MCYNYTCKQVTSTLMKKLKQDCEYCHGNGYVIHDSYDHRGEHVQDECPCECTLQAKQ